MHWKSALLAMLNVSTCIRKYRCAGEERVDSQHIQLLANTDAQHNQSTFNPFEENSESENAMIDINTVFTDVNHEAKISIKCEAWKGLESSREFKDGNQKFTDKACIADVEVLQLRAFLFQTIPPTSILARKMAICQRWT